MRIVMTGSGTHDPAEKTPVTPPIHANADYLAFPERDPQRENRARLGRDNPQWVATLVGLPCA